MSRRLVKRLSEVRTAPSGVMVTHFTGQNLAHMGPKKPVRESLSIPGPARKNEIAGQQRGAVVEAHHGARRLGATPTSKVHSQTLVAAIAWITVVIHDRETC